MWHTNLNERDHAFLDIILSHNKKRESERYIAELNGEYNSFFVHIHSKYIYIYIHNIYICTMHIMQMSM